jgi:tRNA(Ile)-lysidine synthase
MYTLSNEIEQIVKKVLSRHGLLGRGVLMAHSGGLDSTCLTMLLAALLKSGDIVELHVAHIDHGLRECSATDAEASRLLADQLGVKFHLVTLGPEDFPGEGNVQATARTHRRRVLEQIAHREGLEAIALAHHADDQAETVLFRILRGAGAKGAAGMAEWAPPYLRPLLGVRREQLAALAEEKSWPFVTDPTNASGKYARNRIRNELLELAREIVPGADGALLRFAGLIGEDDHALSKVARRELDRIYENEPEGITLPVSELLQLEPPIRRRLLLAALEKVNGSVSPVELAHLEQIEALLERGGTGKEAPIPGAVAAVRTAHRLWLVAREVVANATPSLPTLGENAGIVPAGADSREVVPLGALVARLPIAAAAQTVTFAPRKPGDRLMVRGRERKLKDLLMKAELPAWRRGLTVVASVGAEPVAAFAPNHAINPLESDGGESALLWVASDWWLAGLNVR